MRLRKDRTLTVKAILHIFVEPGKLEDVGEALAKMPEVVDVYEVTGEYDIIATAKANDLHQLRSLISDEADEDAWREGRNDFRRSPHLQNQREGGLRVSPLSPSARSRSLR
jgi:DNA-binding Lrp family transcriptional regulator